MKLSVSAYRAHASAHKKILSSSYQQTLNYGSTAASSSTPATTLFSVSFLFQRTKLPSDPPFNLVLSYCFPLLILLLLPSRPSYYIHIWSIHRIESGPALPLREADKIIIWCRERTFPWRFVSVRLWRVDDKERKLGPNEPYIMLSNLVRQRHSVLQRRDRLRLLKTHKAEGDAGGEETARPKTAMMRAASATIFLFPFCSLLLLADFKLLVSRPHSFPFFSANFFYHHFITIDFLLTIASSV